MNETANNVTETKKQPKFVIYRDSAGAEIGRKERGPGRPPTSSVEDADGNLIVSNYRKNDDGTFSSNVKAKRESRITYYITVDDANQEVSREQKKRGPARKGYALSLDGPNKGHYVGKPVAKEDKKEVATA